MSKNINYTITIDAEIANLTKKAEQAKASMANILNGSNSKDSNKIFEHIEKSIDRLKEKAKQPVNSEAVFGNMVNETVKISNELDKLSDMIVKVKDSSDKNKMELFQDDIKKTITGAQTALKTYNDTVETAKTKSQEYIQTERALAMAQKDLTAATDKQAKNSSLVSVQKKIIEDRKKEVDTINKQIEALKKLQVELQKHEANKDGPRTGGDVARENLQKQLSSQPGLEDQNLSTSAGAEEAIQKMSQKYQELSSSLQQAEAQNRKYEKALEASNTETQAAQQRVNKLTTDVDKFKQELDSASSSAAITAYEPLRDALSKVSDEFKEMPIEYTEQAMDQLNGKINNLVSQGLEQVNTACDNASENLREVKTATDETRVATEQNAEAFRQENAAAQEVSGLVNRIKYFVGLEGAVQLARRALSQAFNTIKELDAAMTEMAVVTDLGVGDYWERLPEFTKNANALGVTIQDAYEATTLYLQQGLKMAEAQDLANETLKMARIAGLDAADAANKMTAALRGFNMEINEISSQRVADVYSELAAITASDVSEISSAMTKTASIAHSAGMEFETTAAFLSQIIETTRESAETAGTALKTVIARFQELKKDPSEIGEVDGEIVDANKIETALRSVGVSLRDTSGQFRELDDVFLELSSKWDSLDTNTQRYIATIAAGSRQQSRFIAMMSDYNRTTELVSAANDSAGASNVQFEKTMESLDAKLNKLTNSWNTFTMAIMDNQLLKTGIDILNGIMQIINSVVAAFDKIGLGSVASLGMVVVALMLATKALNTFELNLRKTDNSGKRMYTTLGAIGATGKAAFSSIKRTLVQVSQSIKKLPGELSKVGVAAKASAKNINKMQSKEFIAARKAYATATKEAAAAELNYTQVSKQANVTTAQMTAADQRLTASKANLAMSEVALYEAMNLTEKQKIEANALTRAGVEADTSAMLAKYGLTSADVAAYAAKNNLTTAQAAEALASKITQKATLGETVGKLLNNLAIKMGAEETLAETKAKGANTVATWLQTAANWAMQASMWPILLIGLAIVAAFIALVAVIVLIVKAIKDWKKNQPDAQLAALNEKAKAAQEAAEATKEAYDALLTSKEEYDGMIETLDSLTEGTTAWKEAVAELNEKVMELMATYPELAKYITIGKNGAMEIAAAGWEELIESQQLKVNRANYVVMQTQKEIAEFNKKHNGFETFQGVRAWYQEDATGRIVSEDEATEISYDNNGEHVTESRITKQGYTAHAESGYFLDYDVGKENQFALDELSKLTWGTKEYNEALVQLRNAIGETNTEQLAELKAFDQTAKVLAELDKEIQTYEEHSLMALGSVEAQADSNYSAIIHSLSSEYDAISAEADSFSETKWTQGKSEDQLWDNGSNSSSSALKKELARYGVKATGVEDADLAALLAAKGGKAYTKEEIDDMGKGSDEQLVEELKEMENAEVASNYIEELYQIQKENDSIGKLYSDTLDMDLDLIETEIDKIEVTNDVLKNAMKNQVETIKTARKDIDLEINRIYGNGIDLNKVFGDSYDHRREFLSTYQEMMRGAGQELADSFALIMPSLSIEDQEGFFKEYADIDWTSSIDGAAALKEALLDSNKVISVFAQSALELENSFYSATSQANELYRTLSEETLKDLASDGKIAATEILELSKSNDKLATMLDNTGISAATLGRYYEMLENGTLNAATATDDFIRILEKLNSAANSIEDSFAFIDNWEPSRSSTEISSTFSDMRDSMLELYNSGAFGDQALTDYIETFVGAETWQKIVKEKQGDVKAAMEQVMIQVKDFEGSFKQVWSELANNIEGITAEENGSIVFDFDKISNTEELKAQIVEQGWSEEMADALIADAQTFGLNIKQGLKGIDVEEAFVDWISSSVKNIGDKKIIDASQFEAFIKESGLDEQVVKDALAKQKIEIQSAIKDENTLESWVKEAILQESATNKTMDIQETYQLLLDLGLNDTAAKKQLAALTKEMTDVEFTLDGQTVKEAGADLGSITYNGVNYGSTEALINSVQDKKVEAAQKKAALDQATTMGKAMAAASISASNVGAIAMAESLEAAINAIVDGINAAFGWAGVNLSHTSFATDAVTADINKDIDRAYKQMDSYFSADYAEVNKVLNSTDGYDKDKAQGIYDEILKNSPSSLNPSTGTAYEEVTPILTPSNEEEDKWENIYDKLYNLNQELNATIRQREKLERAYERALNDSTVSASGLYNIVEKQIDALKEEARIQEDIAKTALSNIKDKQLENAQYSNLYSIDAKTGIIQVDYEKVSAQGWSTEEGDAFNEFISYLEEQLETAQDAEEGLEDILDTVEEIEEESRDATSDIYNSIKDGLKEEYQAQIDKLQTINDSIQEAQETLMDQLQKQIDEARQARENEKTEISIADKEARLAYLMSDTSGGNALEIAQLQKELEEDKLSYSDALVDQHLQKLQDANEMAAEQRQQQIDIANQQLENYMNSQEIWKQVEDILYNSLLMAQTAENWEWGWKNSEAYRLISASEGIEKKNPIEKAQLEAALSSDGKLAALFTGVAGMTQDEAETVLSNALSSDIANIKDALIGQNGTSVIDSLSVECDNLIKDLAGEGEVLDKLKSDINTLGNTSNGGIGAVISAINGLASNEASEEDGAAQNGNVSSTPPSVGNSTSASEKKMARLDAKDSSDYDKASAASNAGTTSAIQAGIDALLDFTSGGGDFKNDNSAYATAKANYKNAGGTSDFDTLVSNAIKSGIGYTFNSNYDTNQKMITTGTFPNTSVKGLGNGMGAYDEATFTFADGASAKVQVPIKSNEMPNGDQGFINDWYKEAGLTPTDGWVVLYRDKPLVYNKGSWRKFDSEGDSENKMRTIMRKNLNPHFKTGGLADFTGPAWLDGTKSKPEIVLNQQDSANFIQLRDILSEVLNGNGKISNTTTNTKGGDNYFDIEINVDSIGNDYDVEQMADKIRSMLYEDATYRNVNALSQ